MLKLATPVLLAILSPLLLSAQTEVVEVEPNDTWETANVLREGEVALGTIYQDIDSAMDCPDGLDGSDFYMIPRSTLSDLQVHLELSEGEFGAFVRVYRKGEEEPFAESSMALHSDTTLTYRCLRTDTLYVEIWSGKLQPDGCVDYRLSWESLPLPDASDLEPNGYFSGRANRIELGVDVEGRLGYDIVNGSIDVRDSWYLTDFSAGKLTLTVTRDQSVSTGLISIRPFTGVQPSGTSDQIVLDCTRLEEVDTLFIDIDSYLECQAYSLRIEQEPAKPTLFEPDAEPNNRIDEAIGLSSGKGLEGRIGVAGKAGRDGADYWSIPLDEDDTLAVDLEIYGTAEITVTLYNPRGEVFEVYHSDYPRPGDDTISFRTWHFNQGVHTLGITSSDGCAEYFGNVVISHTSSVGEPASAEVKPRLTWRDGRLEINRGGGAAVLQSLQIYDALGREVWSEAEVRPGEVIPVILPEGAYFYRLESSAGAVDGKLVVPTR